MTLLLLTTALLQPLGISGSCGCVAGCMLASLLEGSLGKGKCPLPCTLWTGGHSELSSGCFHTSKRKEGEVKSHEDQRMKSYMGGGGGKPAPWKSGVGPVGVRAGTELGYGPDCRACERRCSPSGGDGTA